MAGAQPHIALLILYYALYIIVKESVGIVYVRYAVGLYMKYTHTSGVSHPQSIAAAVIAQRHHRRLQQFLRTLAIASKAA